MKPVALEIEKQDGHLSDSIERHPAYAHIGASRVSSSHGTILYGSDFEHQHFVTITISRSELHRGLSYDREHSGEELIKVALSEAQWATFVSSLNAGGTGCTLSHIDRVPVPAIVKSLDRRDQIVQEANACLAEVLDDAKKLEEEIEGRGRKTIMRDLIRGIRAQFTSNSGLSFIARQFGEQIEETVEKGKIEVNAYIESRIHRAGLAALKAEPPPIALPGAEEKKP